MAGCPPRGCEGWAESAGLRSSQQFSSEKLSEDNSSGKVPAEISSVCSWQRALCEFINSEGDGICETCCISTHKKF